MDAVPRANRWLRPLAAAIPAGSRLLSVVYSLADQVLAAGGIFLAHVVLARTQTKEDFGKFVLSYSVYTFLYGLYNAAILEPYTVYGSGRYRSRFSEYLRLMVRSNIVIGFLLTGTLLSAGLLIPWAALGFSSQALAGLACTIGVLLSATFLRRTFYVQRQAVLAAKASLVSFVAVAGGIWLATRAHVLDIFSVFFILAFGWVVAGVAFGRKLEWGNPEVDFLELEPDYWQEHWKYSRWALATAFAYQLTIQGYYWLVAAFLSVSEVAELRAMYLLVAPVEQVTIAISMIVLPALATRYAANRLGDLVSLWKRNALAVAGLTGLFAAAVYIAGKAVMHILYAGKFDGLAPLLSLLALSPLFTGIGGTLANALNAVEKPKLVFYACLSGGSATFLLGVPMVTHWGLRGAVLGMLLSGGMYTLALATGFCLKVYKPSRRAIRPRVPAAVGVVDE
jgi:O-antigen/teichoic acid export membrane protein